MILDKEAHAERATWWFSSFSESEIYSHGIYGDGSIKKQTGNLWMMADLRPHFMNGKNYLIMTSMDVHYSSLDDRSEDVSGLTGQKLWNVLL